MSITQTVRGISFELAREGTIAEPENWDFIDSLVPGKDYFFDLGACDGRYSIYAAKKGIGVTAVEPDPKNYAMMMANFKANKVEVQALNVAVGDKGRPITFLISQDWAGGHMKVVKEIVGRKDTNTFTSVTEVKTRMLPVDLFENSTRVTAMKVDVDGSESEFLIGAFHSLKRTNKLLIEFLITDPKFPELYQKILDAGFAEKQRYAIPNAPFLFNIWFEKP
jgi:FkbM family methyltransferase